MATDDLSSCEFIAEDFHTSCGCLWDRNCYRLAAL